MKIIPAILTQNFNHLSAQILNLEPFFDRVQIDIIDGQFAPNQTILPETLSQIETNLSIDFHLMVNHPENWIDRCIAGFVDRIIAQIENMTSQIQFVSAVKNQGLNVGLALDLITLPDQLDQNCLPLLDTLLLMSVPAGFAGQTLDQSIYPKIEILKQYRQKTHSNFTITVDGGISTADIKPLAQSGVEEIAIGRRLTTGNIPVNLEEIQKALE